MVLLLAPKAEDNVCHYRLHYGPRLHWHICQLAWGDSGDVRFSFSIRIGLSSPNDVAGRGRFVQGNRYVAAGTSRVHSPSVSGHQGTGVGQQTGIPMICQTGSMDEARAAEVMAESAAVLRKAGARFAYLHGSRASGQYRPDSDIDIAAYFGGQPPNAFDILMPPGVDLLVLDHAPLELAGRVAARGRLLFDDDPVSRVRWEATTRKIYFDELPRITRAHREFAASVAGRRG